MNIIVDEQYSISEMLRSTLNTDLKIRKCAEERIQELLLSPDYLKMFMAFSIFSGTENYLRQLALVLVRQRIGSYWVQLIADDRKMITSITLNAIHSEETNVRHTCMSILASIVNAECLMGLKTPPVDHDMFQQVESLLGNGAQDVKTLTIYFNCIQVMAAESSSTTKLKLLRRYFGHIAQLLSMHVTEYSDACFYASKFVRICLCNNEEADSGNDSAGEEECGSSNGLAALSLTWIQLAIPWLEANFLNGKDLLAKLSVGTLLGCLTEIFNTFVCILECGRHSYGKAFAAQESCASLVDLPLLILSCTQPIYLSEIVATSSSLVAAPCEFSCGGDTYGLRHLVRTIFELLTLETHHVRAYPRLSLFPNLRELIFDQPAPLLSLLATFSLLSVDMQERFVHMPQEYFAQEDDAFNTDVRSCCLHLLVEMCRVQRDGEADFFQIALYNWVEGEGKELLDLLSDKFFRAHCQLPLLKLEACYRMLGTVWRDSIGRRRSGHMKESMCCARTCEGSASIAALMQRLFLPFLSAEKVWQASPSWQASLLCGRAAWLFGVGCELLDPGIVVNVTVNVVQLMRPSWSAVTRLQACWGVREALQRLNRLSYKGKRESGREVPVVAGQGGGEEGWIRGLDELLGQGLVSLVCDLGRVLTQDNLHVALNTMLTVARHLTLANKALSVDCARAVLKLCAFVWTEHWRDGEDMDFTVQILKTLITGSHSGGRRLLGSLYLAEMSPQLQAAAVDSRLPAAAKWTSWRSYFLRVASHVVGSGLGTDEEIDAAMMVVFDLVQSALERCRALSDEISRWTSATSFPLRRPEGAEEFEEREHRMAEQCRVWALLVQGVRSVVTVLSSAKVSERSRRVLLCSSERAHALTALLCQFLQVVYSDGPPDVVSAASALLSHLLLDFAHLVDDRLMQVLVTTALEYAVKHADSGAGTCTVWCLVVVLIHDEQRSCLRFLQGVTAAVQTGAEAGKGFPSSALSYIIWRWMGMHSGLLEGGSIYNRSASTIGLMRAFQWLFQSQLMKSAAAGDFLPAPIAVLKNALVGVPSILKDLSTCPSEVTDDTSSEVDMYGEVESDQWSETFDEQNHDGRSNMNDGEGGDRLAQDNHAEPSTGYSSDASGISAQEGTGAGGGRSASTILLSDTLDLNLEDRDSCLSSLPDTLVYEPISADPLLLGIMPITAGSSLTEALRVAFLKECHRLLSYLHSLSGSSCESILRWLSPEELRTLTDMTVQR